MTYKQSYSLTYPLVLVRHTKHDWIDQSLFTGWYNIDINKQGKRDAAECGKLLVEAGFKFGVGFTSMLVRARHTLDEILKTMDLTIPIYESWRLNERHYGALTGLKRADCVKKYGIETVTMWRRSFEIAPPPMETWHKYYDSIAKDERYPANGLQPADIPTTESLKQSLTRFEPYWCDTIIPEIKSRKQVIIVLHGNMLRAIVKFISNSTEEDVFNLHIPCGIPFVFELNSKMQACGKFKYLCHEDALKEALEELGRQIVIQE